MAGTCTSISRRVIGSATVIELSRTGANRNGTISFSARISMRTNGIHRQPMVAAAAVVAEGPSCIFVGPLETASQETLEALYCQARDAYYSGEPLIVDDMFDRVELKLRSYGSKSVLKYPRCSIRRHSTYADAEEDIAQAFALASIWMVFLTIGGTLCVGPILYNIILAYQDAITTKISQGSQASMVQFLATMNGVLFMAVGSLIGYPIASSSVKVLQGLWRNDLVALKGPCPNCGEEVFTFVKSNQSNNSPHRADCHVCESLLEFRTKVERTGSRLGKQWVYGRIYLVSRRRQKWK
ncbi:PGR5-like protein 1A, chloroplastic [Mercurialis annua]|uniref:PGR5-like protein 1A, chloroplastic n=1 Tax=Mercurialis annua TaxID=3986 RepID=UPI002160B548|nr:PGR5-like protein 1A, chloroplastic [Mercurialis annua]